MNEPVNIEKIYRIGALDQRVQILAPTETQAANGAIIQTWGEYAVRYAMVTPLGGSEPILADTIIPVSRCRFVLRYDSTINEKYRLVWHAHTYNITSIDVVPRNRFLIITAESNTLSGGEAVDYGDWYLKNSLKIRSITASSVTTITPTQAQITSDVGLTAAAAGAGYIAVINIAALSKSLMVFSDGTYWYYSYVDFTPAIPIKTASAMTTATPTTAQVNSDMGVTPVTGGLGFAGCINLSNTLYLFVSDGTNWSQFNATRVTS